MEGKRTRQNNSNTIYDWEQYSIEENIYRV
jgi:hypothetical protein